MHLPIADRAAFDDATQLLDAFGDDASTEAIQRARRSRDAGNIAAFCRWRQAKRAIALIVGPLPSASIH